MQILFSYDWFKELCRASGKWGILLAWHDDPLSELLLAAPYLKDFDQMNVQGHNSVTILCDTEQEIDDLFDQTHGDEPGTNNPYRGECRIYALTCDPTGQLLTENT